MSNQNITKEQCFKLAKKVSKCRINHNVAAIVLYELSLKAGYNAIELIHNSYEYNTIYKNRAIIWSLSEFIEVSIFITDMRAQFRNWDLSNLDLRGINTSNVIYI